MMSSEWFRLVDMKNFRHLRQDETGATIVEFGLLLPVILGTFLGVLQVGLLMLAHNSLRNVTAETSRAVLVEYQNNHQIGEGAMETIGRNFAPKGGLTPSKFTIDVTQPEVQRVDGAIEKQIAVTYQVTSVVPFLGFNEFTASYTRPLFLIDDVTT